MAKHGNTTAYKRGVNLRDAGATAAYVNATLEEEIDNEEELFLLALRTVAEGYGMTKLATDTALKRESLYRMLSPKGNPRLSSLAAVLRALGLRLAVESKSGVTQDGRTW
jgi:probable addiction module antidote protein